MTQYIEHEGLCVDLAALRGYVKLPEYKEQRDALLAERDALAHALTMKDAEVERYRKFMVLVKEKVEAHADKPCACSLPYELLADIAEHEAAE